MEDRRGTAAAAVAAVRPAVGQRPQIEILVHASGPSGAGDDRRYREQVLGYLRFESVGRMVLFSGGGRRSAGNVGTMGALGEKRKKIRGGITGDEEILGEEAGGTGNNGVDEAVSTNVSRQASPVPLSTSNGSRRLSTAADAEPKELEFGDGNTSKGLKGGDFGKKRLQLPPIGMIPGYRPGESPRSGVVGPQNGLAKSTTPAGRIGSSLDDQLILSPIKTSSETWLSSANIHDTNRTYQPLSEGPGSPILETPRQQQNREQSHGTDQEKQSSAKGLNGGSSTSSSVDIDGTSNTQQVDTQPTKQPKRTPFSGANSAAKLSPHILSTAMALTASKHTISPDSSPPEKRQKVAPVSKSPSINGSHSWLMSPPRKACLHSFFAYSNKANDSLWACSKCAGAGFLGEESFNCVSCPYKICKDCHTTVLSEINRTLQVQVPVQPALPSPTKIFRKSTTQAYPNGSWPHTTGDCQHRDDNTENSLLETTAITPRDCERCPSKISSGELCLQCRYCSHSLCMVCHNARPAPRVPGRQRAKAPPPIITDGGSGKRTETTESPRRSSGSRRSSIDELLLPGVTLLTNSLTPRLIAAKPAVLSQADAASVTSPTRNEATPSVSPRTLRLIAAKPVPSSQPDAAPATSPIKNGVLRSRQRNSPVKATRPTQSAVKGSARAQSSPSASPLPASKEASHLPRPIPPLLPSQLLPKQQNPRATSACSSPTDLVTISEEHCSQPPAAAVLAQPVAIKPNCSAALSAGSRLLVTTTAPQEPHTIPSPSPRRLLKGVPDPKTSHPPSYGSPTVAILKQAPRPPTPPAAGMVSRLPEQLQGLAASGLSVSLSEPQKLQGRHSPNFLPFGSSPAVISAKLSKGCRPIVSTVLPQVTVQPYYSPQPPPPALAPAVVPKRSEQSSPPAVTIPAVQILGEIHHSISPRPTPSTSPPPATPKPAAHYAPRHLPCASPLQTPASPTPPPATSKQSAKYSPRLPPSTLPPRLLQHSRRPPPVPAPAPAPAPSTSPPPFSINRDETPTPPIPSSPLVLPEIQPSTPSSPRSPLNAEIHPPPPQTNSSPPHLTPSLAFLTETLPLSRYFTPHILPSYPTRALRPTERGYWAIPTCYWPTSLKEAFWGFLGDFVGDGRAGWGVWCSLEGWGVRIYCWGEVVGEVWCLVVCASDRAVFQGSSVRRAVLEQGTVEEVDRCSWVDGAERVVVKMA